jgi:murein DD-endopeptidase MepM/ murein hydrolase activator NlpD
MNRRIHALITLASSAALGAGCAQFPGSGTTVSDPALKGRLSHTCKDPNPGNIFREPDGGYHESAQGWFIRAEVHQGTGWAATYCFYGLDKIAPANRPVYSVHYEMTGFKSNECSVSGKTVTCAHLLSP